MADLSRVAPDLRQGVEDLSILAAAELRPVWASLGVDGDPAAARAVLMDAVPEVVATYGSAASTLAADWYDEQREAAGVAGRFRAIPASIPDTGAFALAGWATSKATSAATLRGLVEGGLQRRVANHSRQTIMGSSIADPRALGWRRAGSGDCKTGFCDMLIARGVVYTEKTSDFGAHDHCKCYAVQVFTGQEKPVQPFVGSTRRISDAERRKLEEYLRENYPRP